MNIDSLRSFVALNTEIAGNQTVTFGDDNKQQIVGLNGSPRKLGDAAKLELDQNTVLLKSRILTAVRDAVGGEQSAVFKNIESMLFGTLGKTGQFDPDKATKPLAMRDLQNIVKTLDKAGIGAPATIKGGPGMQLIAKRGDKNLMTDSKLFLNRLNNGVNGAALKSETKKTISGNMESVFKHGDVFRDGLPSRFFFMLREHSLDLNLPGLGKRHYAGEGSGDQLMSDLAHSVSGGMASKYADLSHENQRKVQLLLASITGEVAQQAEWQATDMTFKGRVSLGSADYRPNSVDISFDKDGGVTITSSHRGTPGNVHTSKNVITQRGRDTAEYDLGNSHVALETKTTLPAELMFKVAAGNYTDGDFGMCDTKVTHYELHLED